MGEQTGHAAYAFVNLALSVANRATLGVLMNEFPYGVRSCQLMSSIRKKRTFSRGWAAMD